MDDAWPPWWKWELDPSPHLFKHMLDHMNRPYLEVTYRRGKPLAAYWYLPRKRDDRAARTERAEAGLLVDFAADGRPIGIEITSPASASVEALNRILRSLGLDHGQRS